MITITDREGLENTACECYDVIRQSFARLLPANDGKSLSEPAAACLRNDIPSNKG